MPRPSPVVPLTIFGLALGALVIANTFANKNAPKTAAQIQAEAIAKAEEEQRKREAEQGPDPQVMVPIGKPGELNTGNDLVLQPPDLTLGEPSAPHTLTVGYFWTPQLQADPDALVSAIRRIRGTSVKLKVRLVNLDQVENAPAGLTLDGKTIVPLDPGGDLELRALPGVLKTLSEL